MTFTWNRHVDDIDALFTPTPDWDFELTQLSAGTLGYKACTVDCADVTVTREMIQKRMRNRQTKLTETFLVATVLDNSQPVLWRGQEVQPGQLLIFGDLEIDVIFPQNAAVLGLEVSFDTARRTGLAALPAGLWHCPAQDWSAFVAGCHSVLAYSNRAQPIPAATVKAHRLISLLLSALRQPVLTPPSRHYDVMNRAEAHIALHGWGESQSMDNLADAIGVSRRSMHRAFKTLYGMGPQGFVRLVRLHHFRNTLLNGSAHSVTDAALGAGFEHFGRAAKYYREQFGELPKETLLRAS